MSLRALATKVISGERISPEQSHDADAHDWAALIQLLRDQGLELRAEGSGWYRVVDAEPVFKPMPSGWRALEGGRGKPVARVDVVPACPHCGHRTTLAGIPFPKV